jgi:hypothetical protein
MTDSMSRNYKFKNPDDIYFISFAVVNRWRYYHAMQSRGSGA